MSSTSPYDLCVANPNLCISYILMASYLYYVKHLDSPISDHEFDKICYLALDKWAEIKHRHKKLITKLDLSAGTLYGLREQKYPLIVRCSAFYWLERSKGTYVKIPTRPIVNDPPIDVGG